VRSFRSRLARRSWCWAIRDSFPLLASVYLYYLAGDAKRAEALQASRNAASAKQEDSRKDRFEKEQGDLEKQLGL
jgi:hypothetical protein